VRSELTMYIVDRRRGKDPGARRKVMESNAVSILVLFPWSGRSVTPESFQCQCGEAT
jgi:hypothetical protein